MQVIADICKGIQAKKIFYYFEIVIRLLVSFQEISIAFIGVDHQDKMDYSDSRLKGKASSLPFSCKGFPLKVNSYDGCWELRGD